MKYGLGSLFLVAEAILAASAIKFQKHIGPEPDQSLHLLWDQRSTPKGAEHVLRNVACNVNTWYEILPGYVCLIWGLLCVPSVALMLWVGRSLKTLSETTPSLSKSQQEDNRDRPSSSSSCAAAGAEVMELGEAADDMPVLLQTICYSSFAIAYMNFTVCMPDVHEVMFKSGASLWMSGIVIGAYGIGGLLSLPVYFQLARHSYRWGFLLQGLLTVLGNCLYLHALLNNWSIWLLTLCRVICGMEAGVDLVCTVCIKTCTAKRFRTKASAHNNVAMSLGLILGPVLSSFSRQFLSPQGMATEAVPIACIIIIGAIFFLAVALWMPAQLELLSMCGVKWRMVRQSSQQDNITTAVTRNQHHNEASFARALEEVRLAAAWLALNASLCTTFIRFTQRVAWEAAALWIIAKEYGQGSIFAGYTLSTAVWTSGAAGVIVGKASLYLTNLQLLRIMDLIELVGIMLMFRAGSATSNWLMIFLFGSAVFYGTNMLQAAPISSERSKFVVQSHPILNLEMGQSAVTAMKFCGMFAGPVMTRAILERCPTQNICTILLLLVFVAQWTLGDASVVLLVSAESHLKRFTPKTAKMGEGGKEKNREIDGNVSNSHEQEEPKPNACSTSRDCALLATEEHGMERVVAVCSDMKELPATPNELRLQLKDMAAASVAEENHFVNMMNRYGCVILCPEVPDDGFSAYKMLDKWLGSTVYHDRINEHGIVEINPANPTSINVAAAEQPHLPHTDDAYTDKPSTFMTLQCRVAAPSGGHSVLVSGSTLVKELDVHELKQLMKPGLVTTGRRPATPEAPWLFCSSIPLFWVEGDPLRLHLRWRCKDGCLKEVASEVKRPFDKLDSAARNQEAQLVVALKPHEVLVLDNRAHLHGRCEYREGDPRVMWRKNYHGDGSLAGRLSIGIGRVSRPTEKSATSPEVDSLKES